MKQAVASPTAGTVWTYVRPFRGWHVGAEARPAHRGLCDGPCGRDGSVVTFAIRVCARGANSPCEAHGTLLERGVAGRKRPVGAAERLHGAQDECRVL